MLTPLCSVNTHVDLPLQALHGILFPLPDSPATAGSTEEAVCDPAVAADCTRLLTQVLGRVEGLESRLDAGLARELYAVLTHFVSNLVSTLLLRQQGGGVGAMQDAHGATSLAATDGGGIAPAPGGAPPVDAGLGRLRRTASQADSAISTDSSRSPLVCEWQALALTSPAGPTQAALISAQTALTSARAALTASAMVLTLGTTAAQALPLSETPLGPGTVDRSPGAALETDASVPEHTMISEPQMLPQLVGVPELLGPEVRNVVVSLLIGLASDVAQLSLLQGKGGGGGPQDVQLVRDCLSSLMRLLKTYPELHAVFLADQRCVLAICRPQVVLLHMSYLVLGGGADALNSSRPWLTPHLLPAPLLRCAGMTQRTLLHPSLAQMRECASEMLRSICLLNGTPVSCVWLLRLLADLGQSAQMPAVAAAPFFGIFQQVRKSSTFVRLLLSPERVSALDISADFPRSSFPAHRLSAPCPWGTKLPPPLPHLSWARRCRPCAPSRSC